MKLTVGKLNDTSATLHPSDDADGRVDISGANAPGLAMQIVRAFNRDKHFDALVAALSPFRSDEMGALLVAMIDVREFGGEEAQRRLGRLVKMIDVILDAAEAELEYADAE
jgi:hypothetical protein